MADGMPVMTSFNTQPPEGGWVVKAVDAKAAEVSTHSRLKAAGRSSIKQQPMPLQFQHTAA